MPPKVHNFKHEEPEQDVIIPAVQDVVRFATMSAGVQRATLIVNNCEVETLDVAKLYPANYVENTPLDIPFLDGMFLDVNKAGDVKIKLYYHGNKYPTLANECWMGKGDPATETNKLRIVYNDGLYVYGK